MKVVNLCVSLLILSFIVACQSKTNSSDKAADKAYQVDSLLVLQDSLIGDTIELEGFCVDVCGHGGSHITLMGSDTTQIINVEAGPQVGSFSNDLRNNNVRVKVVIDEQRVDEAFLSDWEHRLDESLKTPQGNPEAVAMLKQQIAEIRAAIAERAEKENKNYYSQYHIVASEYAIQ
ncbi:hypothetical protein [Coprobacter sp.]